MKTKLLVAAMALLGPMAAGLTGCGPVVPVSPTWAEDIRPLMVSRCIRCHDDPPRGDSASNPPVAPIAAYNFNYPASVSLDPLPVGLVTLKNLGPQSVSGALAPLRRMPPSPAEALEDWQIEMLGNWAFRPR